MSELPEIPPHVIGCARTIELFFKREGITDWALMGIQSRRLNENTARGKTMNQNTAKPNEPIVDSRNAYGEDKFPYKPNSEERELNALRALVEQAGHVGYGTAVTLAIERQQQRAEAAEKERDALLAQLQVAKEANEQLGRIIIRQRCGCLALNCAVHGSYLCEDVDYVKALAQLNTGSKLNT